MIIEVSFACASPYTHPHSLVDMMKNLRWFTAHSLFTLPVLPMPVLLVGSKE